MEKGIILSKSLCFFRLLKKFYMESQTRRIFLKTGKTLKIAFYNSFTRKFLKTSVNCGEKTVLYGESKFVYCLELIISKFIAFLNMAYNFLAKPCKNSFLCKLISAFSKPFSSLFNIFYLGVIYFAGVACAYVIFSLVMLKFSSLFFVALAFILVVLFASYFEMSTVKEVFCESRAVKFLKNILSLD